MFRKAAIDKVSSPEQLDLMMQVTSPMGWLALATIGVILVVVGIWSVVGSIPDLVEGQGVLLRGERLYEVKAGVSGTLTKIDVAPDVDISAGQVVAIISRDRAEIEEKIALKQEQLNRLRSQHASENSADQLNVARNQSMLEIKRRELVALREQRKTQEELVRKGLKPGNVLFDFDRKVDGVQGELNSIERENSVLRTRMAPRENEESNVGAEIQQLQGQLERTSTEVKSADSGRVVEVIKSLNDKVREGEPLFRLEISKAAATVEGGRDFCDGNIHAVLYVPGRLAGRVRPGQEARVSPTDVKREEYGYIQGKVEWVSNYAASPEDMREKLKNEKLVQSYNSEGPVFEARVCLTLDPKNKVNGLKWSSSTGPNKTIGGGALCTASLLVDQRKPYTYVIPAVKGAVGL